METEQQKVKCFEKFCVFNLYYTDKKVCECLKNPKDITIGSNCICQTYDKNRELWNKKVDEERVVCMFCKSTDIEVLDTDKKFYFKCHNPKCNREIKYRKD